MISFSQYTEMHFLEKHPYSAQQIFQRLVEGGDYHGGYTIVKEYVRKVRPRPPKAYLSLSFAPGESAQVDWGHCGTVAVGNTKRNLSVFVMVLSHSRQMYIEFTLSQKQEHFLGCHQNAFEYFGGVPQSILVDNLKSAVLEHKRGETPRWNPCYAAFASDYGFNIVACNPRSPQEKGRVENAVGYVKKNFLTGRTFRDFAHIGPTARRWLDQTANQRVHRATGKTPHALWEQEKAQLLALPLNTPSPARVLRQRATSTFRLNIDTNRYSVPAEYAGHYLDIHIYAEEILVYHEGKLIARHRRDYSRHEDHENPDHARALLAQRNTARRHKELQRFLQLGEHAEAFYQGLRQRRLNAHVCAPAQDPRTAGDVPPRSNCRSHQRCPSNDCPQQRVHHQHPWPTHSDPRRTRATAPDPPGRSTRDRPATGGFEHLRRPGFRAQKGHQ